jgi:hypothetical protein
VNARTVHGFWKTTTPSLRKRRTDYDPSLAPVRKLVIAFIGATSRSGPFHAERGRLRRSLRSGGNRLIFAYTISMSGEATKRVGPECLGFTARLLSRVITAVYDDALAEVGLKVSQFSVLNAIANREDT